MSWVLRSLVGRGRDVLVGRDREDADLGGKRAPALSEAQAFVHSPKRMSRLHLLLK